MKTIIMYTTPVWLAVTCTRKARKKKLELRYLHPIPPPRLHFDRHHHHGLKKINQLYINNWMIYSVCPSVHLSPGPSVCPSVQPSIRRPHVHPPVRPEVSRSSCLSVRLSVFQYAFQNLNTRSIGNACRPVRCTYFHKSFWVLRKELTRPGESGASTAGEPVASSLLADPWVRRIPTQTSYDHEYYNKQQELTKEDTITWQTKHWRLAKGYIVLRKPQLAEGFMTSY